tara:strand:- start:8430 stop:8675 length:246 start_codon:yes stop_codon:yes gene_type:complete
MFKGVNELCKNIFNKLELNYPNEKENIVILDKILNDWVMPIFKSICNKYNIDNKCSSIWHDAIIDETTYIQCYVKFLYKHL